MIPFVLIAAAAATADEKAVDPVRTPALVDLHNSKCPMSGEEVDGETHVDWNGVRVQLCCSDCVAGFRKDPAKALGKLGVKLAKNEKDKTVVDLANAKCPIMGKAAKPDVHGDVDGVRVHYCCPNCDKKAHKDPAKAFAALGFVYIPSVVDLRNTKCPISGDPADAETFVDHEGIRVHFCCPDCVAAFKKDPAAAYAKLKVDPAKVKEATK